MDEYGVSDFRRDLENGNFSVAVEHLYALPTPKACAVVAQALGVADDRERATLFRFVHRHEDDEPTGAFHCADGFPGCRLAEGGPPYPDAVAAHLEQCTAHG